MVNQKGHVGEHRLEYLDNTPVEDIKPDAIDIGRDPWAYKYPRDNWDLTWKFINRTTDMPAGTYLVRTYQQAMNSIQYLTQLDIDYERDSNAKTDITIEFTHDLSVFGNRAGVLAQAYLYHPNSRFNGIQQWNDNHKFTPLGWPVSNASTQPAVQIAMHETMHTIGFHHDMIGPSLMEPYVKPGYTRGKLNEDHFKWYPRDIIRLQDAYGKPHWSTRWIRVMQARRLNKELYERYR